MSPTSQTLTAPAPDNRSRSSHHLTSFSEAKRWPQFADTTKILFLSRQSRSVCLMLAAEFEPPRPRIGPATKSEVIAPVVGSALLGAKSSTHHTRCREAIH